MQEERHHPIIARPWEYEIVGLDFAREPGKSAGKYIDLTLSRGAEVRRLRFFEPTSISIEEGFPSRTGGMRILDTSARQLEGIGVQVTDVEGSHGALRFFASSVIELDDTTVDGDSA